MIRLILLPLILSALTILLAPGEFNGQSQNMQEAIIQSIDERLSREGVHSGFLLLHSDSLNLHLELVRSDTSQNGSLMAETPFYTASITKPFTAALVMVLAEQGLLKIDEHITEYLPETMLDSLHMLDGTDYTDRIRVQHLLNHTSGLADYFGDDPISDVNMLAHVLQQPNRFWRPEELIDFTKQRFRPHFPPGEGFHYSDTGYVLLGLIAEEVTGKDLQELYTEIIFDPLQMDHSFINLRSEPADESTPKMAQVYAGLYNIGGLRSLSADWAGGGLVSTLGDLLRFQTAFHDGSLLKKSSSNAMKQWTMESSETTYGFGLRKWETGMSAPEAGEITFVGHTGATGSFMYYSPELDLHLIGTFNQTEESRSIHDFLTRVVQIVLKK